MDTLFLNLAKTFSKKISILSLRFLIYISIIILIKKIGLLSLKVLSLPVFFMICALLIVLGTLLITLAKLNLVFLVCSKLLFQAWNLLCAPVDLGHPQKGAFDSHKKMVEAGLNCAIFRRSAGGLSSGLFQRSRQYEKIRGGGFFSRSQQRWSRKRAVSKEKWL